MYDTLEWTLGDDEEANRRFTRLLQYGCQHLNDRPEIDYFAVSLPDFLVFEDDLQPRHEVHCRVSMRGDCSALMRKSLRRDEP